MILSRLAWCLCASVILSVNAAFSQPGQPAIISYYSGSVEGLDEVDPMQMTHIIYCFGHLQGNRFHLNAQKDSLLIKKMVGLKAKNPALKVLVSLGGWGGCKPCSDVFNTRKGREEFARSVKETNDYFHADGIDLDWEYPSIPGHPGHPYKAADKQNFTALVQELRTTLGDAQTITFAAGGFQRFIDDAVDWNEVMKSVDYVNLMTYDLVHGFSTRTGHHTPLYSTRQQLESTDNCVQQLVKKGVERKKMIIGAAFYARIWENVSPVNNGLYQTGKFKTAVDYRHMDSVISPEQGFDMHWDDTAEAPYAYNKTAKLFATFDDKRSIELKSKYVTDQQLGGIMYWELASDKPKDGLVETINSTLKN